MTIETKATDLPTAIARLRKVHPWHASLSCPAARGNEGQCTCGAELIREALPALLAVAEAAEKLDRHAPDCGATIGGACVCQLGQVSSTLDALAKAVG